MDRRVKTKREEKSGVEKWGRNQERRREKEREGGDRRRGGERDKGGPGIPGSVVSGRL
jgi:hypothetical protein